MERVEKDIVDIVAKVIKKKSEEIDLNVNIFQEYKVDSLLGVEILAALDKKYDIDIPETKLRETKTVDDIIKITKELLSKK